MKTNVNYERVDFDIDSNAKHIKCTLRAYINLDKISKFRFLYKNFEEIRLMIGKFEKQHPKNKVLVHYENRDTMHVPSKVSFTVIGETTCVDDEYDVKTGEHIAETKAQKAAFLLASDFFEMMYNSIAHYVTNLVGYSLNCAASADICNMHANILGGIEPNIDNPYDGSFPLYA